MDLFGNPNSRETSPDDAPSPERRRRLKEAQYRNDERLKGRFEQIFAKYEQDFSDIGDEIDLRTGAVVVNNGHLEQMQHEVDSGLGASATFVRTFQQKLEHEGDDASTGQSTSSDDNSDISDEDELALQSSPNMRVLGSGGSSERPILNLRKLDEVQTIQPLHDDPSYASRLHSSPTSRNIDQPINPNGTENESSTETSDSSNVQRDSGMITNVNSLRQTPGIRNSLATLTTRAGQMDDMRAAVDDATIQALSTDIANKVASLMSSVKNRSSKRKWQRGSEPLWDYPEIPTSSTRPTKRIRHSDLPRPIDLSSPNGKRSLWALGRQSTRPSHTVEPTPSRMPIQKPTEVHSRNREYPTVLALPGPSSSTEHVTCQDCGHKGLSDLRHLPDGKLLCFSCFTIHQQTGMAQQQLELPTHQANLLEDNARNSHIAPETPEREPVYLANTSRRLGVGRKGAYSVEEDALIIKLKESERLCWNAIANLIPGRTALAVQYRYNTKLRNRTSDAGKLAEARGHDMEARVESNCDGDQVPREDSCWDEEKDRSLLHLRETCDLQWHQIIPLFPGHSEADIERRYHDLQHSIMGQQSSEDEVLDTQRPPQAPKEEASPFGEVAPFRFTLAEDAQIVHSREIDRLGWDDIAKIMPARNAVAIKRRYERSRGLEVKARDRVAMHNRTPSVEGRFECIDPQLAPHPGPDETQFRHYEEHEDAVIMRSTAVEEINWDEIAARLPGRVASSVKNRHEYLTSKASAPQHTDSISFCVNPQASSRLDGIPADDSRTNTPPRPGNSLNDEQMQSKSPPPMQTIPPQTIPLPTPPETRQHQRSTNLSAAEVDHSSPQPESNQSKRKTRKSFTEEEDNIIRKMKDEGNRFDQIAECLPGRSQNAVWGRYKRVLYPDSEKKKYRRCSTPATNKTSSKSPRDVSVSKTRKTRSCESEEDLCLETSGTTSSLTLQAEQPPANPSVSDELHNDVDDNPDVCEANYPTPRRDASAKLPYSYDGDSLQSTRQHSTAVPKAVREPRRLEVPLFRQAIDNTLRLQSDLMASAHAAHPHSPTNFHGVHGQPVLLDEDRTSDMTSTDGQILPRTQLPLLNSLNSPSVANIRSNDQILRTPGRLFSLKQYRKLIAAVNDFALQQGKPQWVAKVKQIYEQHPSDSRLESLLEIASTDFVVPSQKPRVFEDVLTSNAEQPHTTEQYHTPVRASERSRVSGQTPIRRLPENPVGPAVTGSSSYSPFEITMPHNLFKNKITSAFKPSLDDEYVASGADIVNTASKAPKSTLSDATRSGTGATSSVQSSEPGSAVAKSRKMSGGTKNRADTGDEGRANPAAVSSRAPKSAKPRKAPRTQGKATAVSTTSGKGKAPVRSSELVISENANGEKISAPRERTKAPQAGEKSTRKERVAGRATAASTSEDQQGPTMQANLPASPRYRTRSQSRSQHNALIGNATSNTQTDPQPSGGDLLTIDNSEDDEEVLLEEDAGNASPPKKQRVTPIKSRASKPKTTASAESAQRSQETKASHSHRGKSRTRTQSTASVVRPVVQRAQRKKTSTSALSTVSSKTLRTPAAKKALTPSRSYVRRATATAAAAAAAATAAATPGFGQSARVATRKQSRATPARAITPTKIINHRFAPDTSATDRFAAAKRVVQTPMRESKQDDSEDELA